MSRIHFQKRRDFIKGASCLVASGAASSFVPQLSLMGSALAQSVTTNYKALVCIYLDGGNDAWNVVIPADPARHAEYVAARGGLFDLTIGPSRLAIPISGSVAGGQPAQCATPRAGRDESDCLCSAQRRSSLRAESVRARSARPLQ
ncbi:MAG: twin-arginine translocation signal domain-containing protein [Xanthomonadaceae bacterium]|jgi:uncharacterized protein (DUF1501 family)|nr:twin-arginine translocation signal domain-containing protein [Xanthomonadaceae bacterium]